MIILCFIIFKTHFFYISNMIYLRELNAITLENFPLRNTGLDCNKSLYTYRIQCKRKLEPLINFELLFILAYYNKTKDFIFFTKRNQNRDRAFNRRFIFGLRKGDLFLLKNKIKNFTHMFENLN